MAAACPMVLLVATMLRLWTVSEGDPNEFRLYAELLSEYNTLVRPVRNHSLPVEVQLSVILQQIVDVDEQNQILEINAWLSYAWNDYKLAWDPADYDGLTDVCCMAR